MPSETDLDQKEFFGSLRFAGERFKSANLPVELLDNVKAYQEVLFSLAADIWRERNPDSRKLPRGFKKNLSLSFSHVEDGSAKAILRSDSSVQAGLLSDEFSLNYMALAQTKFLQISKAANENQSISGISSSARRPLAALISNLRGNESLEIKSLTGKDQQNPSVRYSGKTMIALKKATEDLRVGRLQGIGIIRGILDSSEEIEVLSEHGIFHLSVPSAQLRDGTFPIATFVEFEIQATISTRGQVKKVVDTGKIERIESNQEHSRFLKRLKMLTELRVGWKDGIGESIGEKAARFCYDLSGFICEIYSNVSLFAELDGSVKVEFESRGLEITVICKDDQIRLEVFDDADDDPTEKTFFGLVPKLLADLLNLEDFKN